MAYPTNVFFQPIGQTLGVQPIEQASAAAQGRLPGSTVKAKSLVYGEATFTYLQALTANGQGQCCAFNASTGHTAPVSSISRGPVGIAMCTLAVGEFGWFCTEGAVPCASGTIVANTFAYVTSAAGVLDDTDINTLGLVLTGAKWVSVDSGGFATLNVNSPSISSTAGAGGSGVTSFTAPSGNNANGATVAGSAATLTFFDGTSPGVIGGIGTATGSNSKGLTVNSSGVLTPSLADANNPGAMPNTAYGRLASISAGRLLRTDAYSNGAVSLATATGTLWLQSLNVPVPCTVTGVTYCIGATIGGNVMVSLYGGAVSGGRYPGVTTSGTADGATLIAASTSTLQAGTINRSQTISFSSSVALSGGPFSEYWLGMEFDGASGTINRLPQFCVGGGCMRIMTHTYGTAAASLSSTSESPNSHPVMFLVASQTQLAFP